MRCLTARRQVQERAGPFRKASKMPQRREWYLGSLVDEYLNALKEGGQATEYSTRKYRRIILSAMHALHTAGLQSSPAKIGKAEIKHLRKVTYAHLKPSTARWQLAIVGKFLKYHGNLTMEKMIIAWPQDRRTHVDWLSPEEAVRMLDAAQGVERLVIHLELRLGLRRKEVRGLTVRDVREGIMDVLGKGRGGGKWRTLAWAPDTRAELEHYLSLREDMIARAQHYKPDVVEPEAFIIYQKGKRLHGYGNTAVDSIVHAVARRAGIDRSIGNHTLRRTCGRLMHYAGVPLVDIAEAFGHADTRTTMRYLGLTIDDLSKAQKATLSYLDQVRNGMQGSQMRIEPLIRVRD